jgi:hypothetical protein
MYSTEVQYPPLPHPIFTQGMVWRVFEKLDTVVVGVTDVRAL